MKNAVIRVNKNLTAPFLQCEPSMILLYHLFLCRSGKFILECHGNQETCPHKLCGIRIYCKTSMMRIVHDLSLKMRHVFVFTERPQLSWQSIGLALGRSWERSQRPPILTDFFLELFLRHTSQMPGWYQFTSSKIPQNCLRV